MPTSGIRFRALTGFLLLPVLLPACDVDQTRPGEPARVRLAVVITAAQQSQGLASPPSSIPPSVASVMIEVRDISCAGSILHADTVGVSAEQDSVVFTFELVGATTACFRGAAYSGPRGEGTLVFEGVVENVDLSAGGDLRVPITLGLVGTVPPTVETQPATDVSASSAVFHGAIVPNGFVTAGYFEWGTTTAYGSTTPVQILGDGVAAVALSQLVTGLQPEQTYHYRAVATNSGNVVYGADVLFSTQTTSGILIDFGAVPPPTVTTLAPLDVTETSGRLAGTVVPEGTTAYAYFEWGPDSTYGATTPLANVGAGDLEIPAEALLSGLSQGEAYHYRIVAFNAGGLSLGPDQILRTAGCAAEGGFEVPDNDVDDDCDGTADNVPTCDAGLAMATTNAMDAALAIGLCRQAMNATDWGVISARWVMPNGDAVPDSILDRFHIGHAILDDMGPALPQEGAAMLSLSSGSARAPNDVGYNSSPMKGYTSPYPANISTFPGCPDPLFKANDAAGFEVTVRVPANATSFSFYVKYFTRDYPAYVCTSYVDQFYAFVDPFPAGASPGNVAFDLDRNPISANSPGSLTETGAQLVGTGFESNGGSVWLFNEVPAEPGSEIMLRFVIYDSSDGAFDSLVLIDDFEWHE